MYLKEIKDKDTVDILKESSCVSCGLVPKFTSELMDNGVKTTVNFHENIGWTFVLDKDKDKLKLTEVYCPLCTRKMKLLKLKEGL